MNHAPSTTVQVGPTVIIDEGQDGGRYHSDVLTRYNCVRFLQYAPLKPFPAPSHVKADPSVRFYGE